MARIKLATYNINGIRARLGALLEWLEREQPDIVCLQELKAPDDAFPAGDMEALGYGALWHGQKSWNGVAVLARGAQPVERRRGLPRDPDPAQSRYLEAEVHGLTVGCLYLPNGNPWPGPKFDYKLAWFERLIKHAADLLEDERPVVLAGDFNVVPTDELDIYDPQSWRKDALLQPESRDAYARLLAQGWTDAIRHVHGDARIFTFWDYFRRHWERDAGLRIDHLLLAPTLAPTLHDAGVDRWVRGQPGASDHAPTWVLLDADGRAGAKRAPGGVAAKKSRPGPKRPKKAVPTPRKPSAGAATKRVRKPAGAPASAAPAPKAGVRAKKAPAAKAVKAGASGRPSGTEAPTKRAAAARRPGTRSSGGSAKG